MTSLAQAAQIASVTNASSIAATLTGTTSGNLIVAVVSWTDPSSSSSSYTPSVPSGFTAASNPLGAHNGATNTGADVYYQVSSGGSVTCTFNNPTGFGSGLYARMSLTEWTSMNGTPFDVAATPITNNSAASTTGTTVGASAGLAQSNELVIAAVGMLCDTGLSNAGINDPPSGYTSITAEQDTNASVGGQHSWKEAGSTSGQSCTWTWTSDSSMLAFQAVLVTFKESSSSASRGMPFGHHGTAFNGGRTFTGILNRSWKRARSGLLMPAYGMRA